MTMPLAILAVGSAVVGFLGVPHFMGGGALPNFMEHWLEPVLPHAGAAVEAGLGTMAGAGAATGAGHAVFGEFAAMAMALAASAAGIAGAWSMYRTGPRPETASPLVRFARDKFYVDELYELIVLKPYRALCRVSAAFDARIVDGLVNAAGFATDMAGEVLRLTQTGYVRNYALGFLAGAVLIVWLVLR